MTSLKWELLSNQEAIEEEILEFYTSLVGTNAVELKGIDVTTIRSGKILSIDLTHKLIRPIEEKEIWVALSTIENCKAPGMNGFNSFFLKSTWSIIKKDVIDAVL